MNRLTKLLVLVTLCVLSLGLIASTNQLVGTLPAGTPSWNNFPGLLPDGCLVEVGPGQEFVICMPQQWNGVLMIYAHGYTPVYPRAPSGPFTPWNLSPEEFGALVGDPAAGGGLIQMALDTGAAVAMTSYSAHGWAIEQALGDIPALYQHFYITRVVPNPFPPVIMVGASEGGLVTTMITEKVSSGELPLPVVGGLAACGPLAGAEWQVEYLGDFRVWFDHYFSGVLPGAVDDVPDDAWMQWDSQHVGAISQAIDNDFRYNWGRNTRRLFWLTGAPSDYGFWKADAYIPSAVQILYYNIWGTDDVIEKAGGQPYDNSDEWLLHRLHPYHADPGAEAYIRAFYEPTGNLAVPLVTLHTTRDPAVPVTHEFIYADRAYDSGNLTTLIVPRYGHCNFQPYELQVALWVLQYQISQNQPAALSSISAQGVPAFTAAAVDHQTLNNAGIYEVDLTTLTEEELLEMEAEWSPRGQGNGPPIMPPGHSDDKPGNGP